MKEQLADLYQHQEDRTCEECGSKWWRILHEGDESNCSCLENEWDECLRVCAEEYCDGVAELSKAEPTINDINKQQIEGKRK